MIEETRNGRKLWGTESPFKEDPLPKRRITDTKKWFAALDRLNSEPFMIPAKKVRNQPATPRRKKL
jgi:hypothetical protein